MFGVWGMNNKNCPNCGAVYTLKDIKCPYCGTLYFDLTTIDFTKNEPVFVKMRVPNGSQVVDITQCAYPRLGDITVSHDTIDCVDNSGMILKKVYRGCNMTTNITFDAVPFDNNRSMYEVRINE